MPAGSCNRCGVHRRWLHGHHIVPRSEGGSDDPSNIEDICANCHEDAHGSPFGNLIRAARRRAAREAAVPRELLVRLYVEDELTMQEIADRLGVGKSTIHYWLDDYGIERRRAGRAFAERPNRETLVRLYLHEKRSLEDIAAEFSVSRETVRTWCRRDGIAMRSKQDAARALVGLSEEEATARERIRAERARHRERFQISEKELRKLYLDQGLTYAAIAEMKGVSIGFVAKKIKALGIERSPGRVLGSKLVSTVEKDASSEAMETAIREAVSARASE